MLPFLDIHTLWIHSNYKSVIILSLYLPHHLPHCIISIVYSTPRKKKKNRDHFNLPRYVLVGWYSIFLLFKQSTYQNISALSRHHRHRFKLGRCHGEEQVGESLRFQGLGRSHGSSSLRPDFWNIPWDPLGHVEFPGSSTMISSKGLHIRGRFIFDIQWT